MTGVLDSLWFSQSNGPIVGIVAKESEGGQDWAAYIAAVAWPTSGNADERQVCDNGAHLPEHLARAAFPQLKERAYRA